MTAPAPAPGAAAGRPAVSVVMPMRNPGRFVEQAVAAILGQGVAGLELVVVDDGCTDGSRQYIDGLRDDRIRVVDGPRSGIAACMNAALALARGEVVMRCDADDVFPPGRIAAQLAFLDAHPRFVAVCGPFTMMDPQGRHVASPRIQPSGAQADVAPDILAHRLRTHLCAFAFRRGVLERIGGFRPFFQTAEDIDFQLRLATAGPVGFLPANAYEYRLHDASITHSQASGLRLFFEETAYAMSRDRQASGTDALMRGQAPPLPDPDGPGRHADKAAGQMSRLMVGEAWRRFQAGDRAGARRAAWRAALASPGHWDAWRSLLLVSVKPRP